MVIPDSARTAILHQLGVGPDAVLGSGGEATVFALDATRVVRVLHPGGRAEQIRRRQALVDELARSQATFALPAVLDVGEIDGRVFAIERRLPGRSVMDELIVCDDLRTRARMIEAHLDVAAALGDLHLSPRDYYGDLLADDPVRTTTWRGYLEERVVKSLRRSVPDLRSIDPIALASSFDEPAAASFVHLDAFTGNMLTDGRRVTAVLDIGETSVVGDRRLDPVAAVAYFESPDITAGVTPRDVDVAMGWLRNAGLDAWLEPARRWLAAYWSFAIDDPSMLRWCRAVLLSER